MADQGERGFRGRGNRGHGNRRGNNFNWRCNKKRGFQVLEPGAKGFFCTCNNFQEKACIREAYNLLNEFAPLESPIVDSETCEDPSELLHQQIAEMKAGEKQPKRFYSLDTNVGNCVFIQANVDDITSLGHKIAQHIADNKVQRTRFLTRMIPIEITCGVSIKDITLKGERLIDKHFSGEPTTFCIVFNRRYNDSVTRDILIKELGNVVASKNSEHKVDLSNPKLVIVVEVLKGVCMMNVISDYFQLKKYNLIELCVNKNETSKASEDNPAPVIDIETTSDDANAKKSTE